MSRKNCTSTQVPSFPERQLNKTAEPPRSVPLDAEESWTDEERWALSAHIEEGYLQAKRGELIDGAQSRAVKFRR